VLEANALTANFEPINWTTWHSLHLTTLYASTACYRDSFTSYGPNGVNVADIVPASNISNVGLCLREDGKGLRSTCLSVNLHYMWQHSDARQAVSGHSVSVWDKAALSHKSRPKNVVRLLGSTCHNQFTFCLHVCELFTSTVSFLMV
jgi:hypothetical protein